VADSVPQTEHDECRNKAAAVLAAITMAEGLHPAGSSDARMTHH
jgi:anthranilate/para-aminobenzoate synthase component I